MWPKKKQTFVNALKISKTAERHHTGTCRQIDMQVHPVFLRGLNRFDRDLALIDCYQTQHLMLMCQQAKQQVENQKPDSRNARSIPRSQSLSEEDSNRYSYRNHIKSSHDFGGKLCQTAKLTSARHFSIKNI